MKRIPNKQSLDSFVYDFIQRTKFDALIVKHLSEPITVSGELIMDYSWERIYCTDYNDTPREVLDLYVLGALFAIIYDVTIADQPVKCLQLLDRASIMANPQGILENIIQEAIQCIAQEINNIDDETKDIRFVDICLPTSTVTQVIEYPSIESFVSIISRAKPVVLKKCIDEWPSLTKWNSFDYWTKLSCNGHRLVPIEIGRSYIDNSWSQQFIPFGDFLSRVTSPVEPKYYLAQHNLFQQFPSLLTDFQVPDYCYAYVPNGLSEPMLNIWFGPANTITPAHTDPHHNLFCQVVGYKRIVLFPAHYQTEMYPYADMLCNTSSVDIEQSDLFEFPLFPINDKYECTLGPGEMLYIPRGWWHFVKSITTSISISIWF